MNVRIVVKSGSVTRMIAQVHLSTYVQTVLCNLN